MRVNDKKYFSYNWDTLKLKTAEFIGSRFPVHQTRSPRSIMHRISFSSSKTALQFILGLPQVEDSRRFVNGAEKVTSVFFGGKEVFADEGQGKQRDIKSVRRSRSVSPAREPPRLKTSRQQTVVATTISPPRAHNFSCNNSRSNNAQKEQHPFLSQEVRRKRRKEFYGCKTGFINFNGYCFSSYSKYQETGDYWNRYLRIGGMLDILRYLESCVTRTAYEYSFAPGI